MSSTASNLVGQETSMEERQLDALFRDSYLMDAVADLPIMTNDLPFERLVCGKGVAIKSIPRWMYETIDRLCERCGPVNVPGAIQLHYAKGSDFNVNPISIVVRREEQ
jgi:hypothetical protein